jgi:hypothetical protein
MIGEIRLPIQNRTRDMSFSSDFGKHTGCSRRTGGQWLLTRRTGWLEKVTPWIGFALGYLRGPCIQARFLPLRANAGFPLHATNVTELGSAGTPARGQRLREQLMSVERTSCDYNLANPRTCDTGSTSATALYQQSPRVVVEQYLPGSRRCVPQLCR